jgi:hypothetical protein
MFCWDPTVKLGDFITGAGFIIASLSLLVSTQAFMRNSRAQQVKSLFDVMNQHFGSKDIRVLFDKLDMNKDNPDAYRFPGSYQPGDKDTAALSKLLYMFDVVGRKVSLGILKREDLDLIAFRVWRTMENDQTQEFLKYLDGEYRKYGPPSLRRAHADARSLYEELGKPRRS